MVSNIISIPLFPLNYVLFPHLPLRLHIFEERYKVMINRCLDNGSGFGITLIKEWEETGDAAEPSEIGCIVEALMVEHLDEGRMNILVVGRQRFRLLEYAPAEEAYLVGRVEFIDDDPEPEGSMNHISSRLSALFTRYLELLAGQAGECLPPIQLPEDPVSLSFCAASALILTLEQRQVLLALTNTQERITNEIDWLIDQITLLESITLVSEPGNLEPFDSDEEMIKKYIEENRN